MKKLKKIFISIFLIIFLLILTLSQDILANNFSDSSEETEYSEEYLKWLELPNDEKKNVIMPRMYDVPYNIIQYNNPLRSAKMLRASLDSRYSLKDIIPSNLEIRDQMQTGSCWAFSALSSLETNLALTNYKNGTNISKVYDFSERHMEYATSRVFANNQINLMGYNRTVGSGGNWAFASSYLTNGSGAIDESEMPFENNEDIINISEIQNKTVTSQVFDTIEFSNYNRFLLDETEANEIMNQIKYHIQNYGSVMTSIKTGGFIDQSKVSTNTGALYLGSGAFGDHAVSIIGWDDNYGVENWNEFEEAGRPQSDGAWIARNSWGENNSELIYISYEDETATLSMSGVIKSTDIVKYDNIYQYDYYYPNVREGANKSVFCNVFDKKNEQTEYLTQVSFYATYPTTCRVYVNSDGTEKSKEDLQLVTLKAGESETLSVGYHTLEFSKPIEINSDKFLVAIEFLGDESNPMGCIEKDSYLYTAVEPELGNCFKLDTYEYRYEDDWSGWVDLAEEGKISTIKAFTTNELIDESLKNIEIVTPPTKTLYFEGENFDSTGMEVRANYNSRTNPSVILDSSSFNITNGTNLKVGQTSVTITYEDQSIEQPITVEKNSVTDLIIKTPPTKTEYKEGQNFDKTGMVIEAKYKDGTTKEVTDYTIENGNNLKVNQTEITISFEENTITQAITVIPNPLIEIAVTKEPNKTKYVVGQSFDKTGMVVTGIYQDESTYEIIDYTIEDGTNLTKGQTYVTINYEGKTTTQEITVEEKLIDSISIDKEPTKLTYIQNKEELDLTGGTLKVTYNDESTENVALDSENINVTGFDNTKLGKQNITVTYQNKTTQFEVEIIEEVKAINSDLDNTKCDVQKVQVYIYTDNSKKDYTLIDVEINQIIRNLNNDKVEYYYYLSSNSDEQNISDWIKITEEQNLSDKLQFTIDTRNISNYNELTDEEPLYLYIREVALNGGDQSIAISNAMSVEVNDKIETYIDNAKVDNVLGNNVDSNNSNNIANNGSTIAQGRLPYAGIRNILIIILIVLVLSILFYIRYKNLQKYIK